MADSTFGMPPEGSSFEARGGWLINKLASDPALAPLTVIQAAGIVGNLAGESGIDPNINEVHPVIPGSRGGFGWAQWTDVRRINFEKWATDHQLDVGTDEANYGFLVSELLSNEAHSLQQLRKTTTVEAAVYTFEVLFERPSDPQGGLQSRIHYAQRALASAANLPAPEGPTLPPVVDPPTPSPPEPPIVPVGMVPETPRTPWWTAPSLGVIIMVIFAGALTASVFLNDDTLRTQMFTAAAVGFGSALQYFFGSSAGSQKKDDVLAASNAALALSTPPSSK